jgi:hypothetical protein
MNKICVVSGDTRNLTRHHVVPSCFRRNFTEERKSNYAFVVPLRKDLHNKYTIEEQRYYKKIAKMYGVPDPDEAIRDYNFNDERKRAKKIAKALLSPIVPLPKERFDTLKQDFIELTGVPLYNFMSEVELWLKTNDKFSYRDAESNFGRSVVAKIEDLDAFEVLWLKHFVKFMKPKFLPEELKKLLPSKI